MTVATVASYVKMYWSGLKEQLDLIDSAIYADFAANATVSLELFDHSFLTSAQVNQAEALLICVEAAGSPSISGNSSERHFDTLKIYDRTMKKISGLDWSIGEFCRLLKITLSEFNAKTATTRANQYTLHKSSSIYLAPDLDSRGKVFKDYELSDLRKDRESYPLDNRYL